MMSPSTHETRHARANLSDEGIAGTIGAVENTRQIAKIRWTTARVGFSDVESYSSNGAFINRSTVDTGL
jgi:uncharacterized protein YhbP (UPF0306 family)